MIRAAPSARPLAGVALGLCDGLVLRPQREIAPGAVFPHPARRRQSDDDQRDLRPDPQAGARRRRLVRQGRHQRAGPGHGRPFRADRRHASGLADPVGAIETDGRGRPGCGPRAAGSQRFDTVASNGDVVHSYDLVEGPPARAGGGESCKRKRFSPSLFVRSSRRARRAGRTCRTIRSCSARATGLLGDIYKRGMLPDDPSLYLHHPTATDPGMAPPGRSTLYALAPVPHLGKLPIDWAKDGAALCATRSSICSSNG